MSRRVVKGIALTAVTAAVLFLVFFFGREYINNYLFRLELTSFTEPAAGSRVLVIAPHPDDETLGPGILLSRLVKKGVDVRIVVMTNGDGFTDALAISYHELKPRREDYLRFGYTRQQETVAAMSFLGIPEKAVTFLGYPDGGLLHLWSGDNWSAPYTSTRTGQDHNPYRNALSTGAPYTGASVVSDLRKVINEFRPDYVIYPHPNDRHPDHLASYCFTKYVLNQLENKAQQFQYLVHRGDWPVLFARHQRMFLVPPRVLVINNTDWYAFTLGNDEIPRKGQAIRKYTSQVRVMGPRLLAFDRKNELFAAFKDAAMMTAVPQAAPVTPEVRQYILESDPFSDVLLSTIEGAGDLVGLYGYKDATGDFQFYLEAREKARADVRYVLDLFAYRDAAELGRISVYAHDGQNTTYLAGPSQAERKTISDVTVRTSGRMVQITVPGRYLQDANRFFIGATTFLFGFRLDSMAWRFYHLE